MIKNILISALSVLLFFSAQAQRKKDTSSTPVDPAVAASNLNDYYKPVKWRSIGPFRGGRSNTATGVVGDINTYYMGTTGG